MHTDVFIRQNTPEQYAEAFQQMIDAREKWREQIINAKMLNDPMLNRFTPPREWV